VAANIAEGYGRQTKPAYLGFLRISRGSLRELETHLIIADRVGLAETAALAALLEKCDEQARILHALIDKLEKT
jgi:four helix bundle protein